MRKQVIIWMIAIFVVLTGCGSSESQFFNQDGQTRSDQNESSNVLDDYMFKYVETTEECTKVIQTDLSVTKLWGHKAKNYGICLLLADKPKDALGVFEDEKKRIDEPDKVLDFLYDSAYYIADSESTFERSVELAKQRTIADDDEGFIAILSAVEQKVSDKAFETEEADQIRKNIEYHAKYFAPEIGMSAEKVLESTWGKPVDINKTTTKYGVHEQWVYYGGRYLYLEDGVVTSIQE
ncbi:hypothetical protein J2Z22_004785 [Paenibacillus forsythiae]|uniref:Uncharacterized protein n=1 Tax=Paenibacillus forsythiae TaxID=365616 RepID=A0ABU3HEP7_9BACL|nr:hypothetical protein [Paenibacillus forsythiae]MDT3429185.1 hypothetical protein [Paenibacillus forsythiae]